MQGSGDRFGRFGDGGNYPLWTSEGKGWDMIATDLEGRHLNGFDGFCRSIYACPGGLMATFSLYCDDSGTHDQSPIAVAACFVSTVEQWERFNVNWKEANDAENFGTFHMADFVAKKGQFSLPEWQDDAKRDRTLKRLIAIINLRRRVGFFGVVEKAAYDEEVPKEYRQRFKLGENHYTFAVRMCMAKVLKWRLKYGYTEPVQFVFDRLSKGKGEITAMFDEALREGDERALLHGISKQAGWSFSSKEQVWPLQAADIFAWETLHYMQKSYLPQIKETPRKSYAALVSSNTAHGLHDRESLRRWIAHLRQRIGEAAAS
jgi:Protein of unknown function (DUF3800)